MKPEHFLYKSDGLYYMQNVPEKPVANRSGRMFSMFGYEYELAEYKAALERTKAEAVKCDEVLTGYVYNSMVHESDKETQESLLSLKKGRIHTINMEEKIEVVEIPCEGAACPSRWGQSCIHSKLIARIVAPKKEEESKDEFIAYIESLKNQSFEGWNEHAVSGYTTALLSLYQKYVEIKRKPL